ncbi:hypothetical protein P691DRAFT_664764 [Macrolepiota fuliginosa MF-IS2]|uniref:Zn(2)-C6 fungal-type domain-containing protein n=1 Tax=Macrolepiota fuliginosa MF-IS2 TaxID=1400762 RepID=A0A9P6C3H2_9AGAR|nr:hypothetical protein P691DRAFT_664764 [Macrolepiota fuliginosa MF-IS2]
MPVDTTRVIPTRRSQKKISDEEMRDIEMKRIRGELSCAECRRLKLKCDKKVPCSSCVRRGCESICPCGILSAGQGTRFILADTEQLHRKISEMSNRIRQLEDALAILQATVSDRPHPLLKDDLLKVKFGSEALSPKISEYGDEEEDTRATIDALGTLTLGESGESRYFGRSAGSEASEAPGGSPLNEEAEDLRFPLSPDLENLSNLFPFTRVNMPNTTSLSILESHFPHKERATSLFESYCNHASYFYRPIKREELFTIILPSMYDATNHPSPYNEASPPPDCDTQGQPLVDHKRPHDLATVFFVLALGALFDLNLPPYNTEAEHFYDLGRAALSLQAAYESPSINTVQAMGLMATYHSSAGRKYSRDSAWCIMSFAAKLAQSIGLHRDSARWRMDAITVQKRRNIFWETFAGDVSHSLALGRPPAIHLSYVDCEFPLDEEATLDSAGSSHNGFWKMKHVFAKDIFYAVAAATLTAKAPSYKTVLDLDRKVREMSFPAYFKPYVTREEGEEEFYSSSLSLRGFYASQHRTVTMLYLHRSFFAQAVLDYPANPLLSPFAPSFLTAYRCASVIIRASAHQFERCAALAMRVWFLMYHTFSAAVIVGTVVTRSPNSTVSASALLDLDVAIDLFEKAAKQSYRAEVALGVLRKLKEKAVRSYKQSCSLTLPAQMNSSASNSMVIDPQMSNIFSAQSLNEAEDELAIFGGQTRVLTRKTRHNFTGAVSPLSSPETYSPSDTTAASPVPALPVDFSSMPEVHPSLIEYLKHDSIRMQHIPLHHQSPPHSSHASPAASASQNGSGRRSGSGSPTSKEMGEMYNSFMGYLASKSISNTPIAPGVVPPSMRDYRPPTQGNESHRRNLSGNAPTPSAINNWEQQPGTRAQRPRLHSDPQTTSSGISTTDANALNSWMALNPANAGFSSSAQPNQYFTGLDPSLSHGMGAPSMAISSQGGMEGATYTRGDPMAFQNYGVESYFGDGLIPGTGPLALNQNPIDPMVEMGLTSESGMDEGWLSFMRECGIMENGRPSA